MTHERTSIEQFPSEGEITKTLEFLLQGKKYTEVKSPRVERNEDGISLYEIELVFESGERVEYNYQRAHYDYRDTALPPSAQFSASIHAVTYDTEGGIDFHRTGCVANYLDGAWQNVPPTAESASG